MPQLDGFRPQHQLVFDKKIPIDFRCEQLETYGNLTKALSTNTPSLPQVSYHYYNSKIVCRIVFTYLNIFFRSMCLANYGASEAVYPCNVVENPRVL
jgi:hypothetical protein